MCSYPRSPANRTIYDSGCWSKVRSRDPTVALVAGWCFLPPNVWPSMLAARFRRRLTAGMTVARLARPVVLAEDGSRFGDLFAALGAAVEATARRLWRPHRAAHEPALELRLTPGEVPTQAVHFPPCIRGLYSKLQDDHHLKYDGRLVFTLFLKSAGMSLTEQLGFWEGAFQGGRPPWQRKYSYGTSFRRLSACLLYFIL